MQSMSPVGTILCALDLHESGQPVMAVAASLARALHTGIDLLHIVHLPPGLQPEHLADNVIVDVRREAGLALEARAAELRATGINVQATIELGLVHDGIVKRGREIGADLIVMGTHARHGLARAFLGSVAERTARAASCPVVIVPPSARGPLTTGEGRDRPLKIVAGVDLSPASDAALAWLRAIDRQVCCEVRLVHLYWPPREHQRLGLEPPDPFEADPEVTAVLARDLRTHIAVHFGRDDVPLRVRPLWGSENDSLAWEAETDGADLLVVGTSQGRHSTAIATVWGASLPVVSVPGAKPETAPIRLAPVRTVLVTADFSPLGGAAVQEAYRLLLQGGGNVVLIHVAEPGPFGLDPDRRNEIETCLLGLVPHGMDDYAIRTRTIVVADKSVAEAIVKAIRRLGPDLVVMSSHVRSGFRRAIHSSVTDHVMRQSPRPVLVVPVTADAPVEAVDDQV